MGQRGNIKRHLTILKCAKITSLNGLCGVEKDSDHGEINHTILENTEVLKPIIQSSSLRRNKKTSQAQNKGRKEIVGINVSE